MVLTAYFGVAAWRLSTDHQNENVRSPPPFQLVRAQSAD
jgi:hypothetical protein